MQASKTVVTFSGGMDSATLIAHLKQLGHEVIAISVDYGQRHRVELEFAARFTQHMGIQHEFADLRGIAKLLSGSSLTDSATEVPRGHYGAESMKKTVVPNRNMLLLATATALAVREKANFVAYAAHSGDHTIYPDCRPEFADAMATAIGLCDWHTTELIRPFITLTKADIVRRGSVLNVPFRLTWSCYDGGALHCGACGTCIERREAFALAKIDDPTEYDESAPALNFSDGLLEIDWSCTLRGNTRHRSHRDPVESAK